MTSAVVIAAHTWDRFRQIEESVASVLAGDQLPLELFVVVDNNPELTLSLAEAVPTDVQVINSDGVGLSAARNTGLSRATADVVVFLDDDAAAEPGWLAEIERAFASNDQIVGVGGRIVPIWPDDRRLAEELWWIAGCTYLGHPLESQPITRPIGCSMAFKRDALIAVGGFNAAFGRSSNPTASRASRLQSNEEIALSVALREMFGDDSIWYLPEAVVHHHVAPERLGWSYMYHRSLAEGRSKADVAKLHGNDAMGYDASYVKSVLLPGLVRYAKGAVVGSGASLRQGAQVAFVGCITASGFIGRTSRHRFAS